MRSPLPDGDGLRIGDERIRLWGVDDKMIDLAQRSEPYEIALAYGLSVTVKPLTTAAMAAAQAAARRTVEAIERQARERREAGLALDGLPDLSAEGGREGFYQAQLIRELAVRHITSWSGVELKGGPAPPTLENITAVMELYPVGERFFQEFTLRQVLLNAAKNMYGRLPPCKGVHWSPWHDQVSCWNVSGL